MTTTTTYAGDVHRLATRVARAARLADSPIGYYHAHADIRRALETRALADLPAFYERHYGAEAWNASADTSAPVVEIPAPSPAAIGWGYDEPALPITREELEPRCYCPGDCGCRHTGAPYYRTNVCGCKQH